MSIKYEINPAYAPQVQDIVKRIADSGIPVEATCVYTGRNKIFTVDCQGITINIKSFREPGRVRGFIYTNIVKSKARRSYLHAGKLLSLRFPTPAPLAWIEKKESGRLKESYYLSIHEKYPHDLRRWEEWDADMIDEVLPQYALLMYRLHQSGIYHRDLSPGNVLWQKDDKGKIRFSIVDLNRMRFYRKPLKLRKAFRNFRNINLIEEETARLGRIYGAVRSIDGKTAEKLALNALRGDRKRKKNLHKLRDMFKKKK